MPFPTFAPPIAPSPGNGYTPTIKLKTVDFGDGYTQAMPDGLNHIRQSLSLKWKGVTLEQRNAILAFLESRAGYLPFWYKPYGFTSALKWTCAEWSSTSNTPWEVSATLAQSFMPGT